jgi:hypothetical protein
VRLVAIILALLQWPTAWADSPSIFVYHGWNVDLSRVASKQPLDKSIAVVTHQLDIVEAVHLSPEVLSFMRTIPIWADPSRREGGPGFYHRPTGVDFHVRDLDPDKPIILHELLHAFHDRRLGFDNADIERFYEQARHSGNWPSDTYFLTNVREFFAVTSSIYLYGNIPRPPFSREKLLQTQPDYYHWLAELFDDGKERPTADSGRAP